MAVIRSTRLRAAVLTAVALASAAACDAGGSSSGTAVEDDEEIVTGNTLTEAQDDGTPPVITLDGSTDNDPDPTAPSDPEAGSCEVEVTGAESASWTSPGGPAAVGIDYWLTTEERDAIEADFYFVVLCEGDGGTLAILGGPDASRGTVPFGPATYVLHPTATTDDSTTTDDVPVPLQAVVSLGGVRANWALTEPGTVSITAFDNQHIAGTVQLTARDTLAVDEDRTIEVTVTFDLDNPKAS